RTLYANGPLIAMALALQADGVPKDKLFPMDMNRAFRKLQQLKPSIKVFWRSGDESEQLFRNGEVAMGTLWNGRAFHLAKTMRKFKVMWEGAVYEPTYLTVVKGAPNAGNAFRYIEWVATHPDGMAKYAEKSTYDFPNPEIFKLLPPDIVKWLPSYPDNFAKQVRLDT